MNYIHDAKTKTKMIFEYLLCLCPLLGYGLYKNGFLVYQKGLISFGLIFKPLYLVLITLGIYELIYLVTKRKLGFDYDVISYVLVSLAVSPNINILYFAIIMLVSILLFRLLFKKVYLNHIAIIYLIFYLIVYFMHELNFASILEQTTNYSFDYFDLLMGRQIGGIASTSIIISLVIYFFLYLSKNIKSIIPLVSYGTYFFLMGTVLLIQKEFNFSLLFNANVIFALIFVATEAISSPNTRVGKIIYGVVVGILTVVLSYLLNPLVGPYMAILLASTMRNIYDIELNLPIFTKKYRKNKGNRI